jgi:hypothetical protein
MSNAPAQSSIVLRPDMTNFIVATMVFGGIGGSEVYHGNILGWIVIGFAACLACMTVWVLASQRFRLRLSPEGFRFGNMRRTSAHRWSDVQEFVVRKDQYLTRVGIRFTGAFEAERRARQPPGGYMRINRRLPCRYGMREDALCRLLENWRLKYADAI